MTPFPVCTNANGPKFSFTFRGCADANCEKPFRSHPIHSTQPAQNSTPQIQTLEGILISESTLILIEKVSAVALLIYSTYINLEMTLPFLALGASIGVYHYVNPVLDMDITYTLGGCAQGLLERLMKVRLPAPFPLLAELNFLVGHIEEHSTRYCPYIGILAGIRLGETIAKIVALNIEPGC